MRYSHDCVRVPGHRQMWRERLPFMPNSREKTRKGAEDRTIRAGRIGDAHESHEYHEWQTGQDNWATGRCPRQTRSQQPGTVHSSPSAADPQLLSARTIPDSCNRCHIGERKRREALFRSLLRASPWDKRRMDSRGERLSTATEMRRRSTWAFPAGFTRHIRVCPCNSWAA
jgi:hypothetical protein